MNHAGKLAWVFFLAAFVLGILASGLISSKAAQQPSAQELAQKILRDTRVAGGLVVQVGCRDGRLAAALRASNAFLVHVLEPNAGNAEKARSYIASRGLYGPVSVEHWPYRTLPHADNTVNLVVSENLGRISMAEVMRVLRPGGVAYIKRGQAWRKTQKPWPTDVDQWTHFLHGPDNNAVAKDLRVGPPRRLQWVGSPRWARAHEQLASVSAVVCANGRVFAIVDEGPTASIRLPARWFLVARDAFNGVLLWEREIGPWEWHLRGFRTGPAELPRRLVAVGDRVYVTLGYGQPVSALDAATGKTVRTYENTEGADEIVYDQGVLYVAISDAQAQRTAAQRRQPTVPPAHRQLVALDAESGRELWRKNDDDTLGLFPLTLAVADGRVFFQNTAAVVCLDAKTGKRLWRTPRPTSLNRPTWSAPTLVVAEDVVLCADRLPAQAQSAQKRAVNWVVSIAGGQAPEGELIALSAKTGEKLWSCPCREGYNSPTDVFFADGLVWVGETPARRGPDYAVGRDLHTGEVKRTIDTKGAFLNPGMAHHRCYRDKATERFILAGRAGIEFIPLNGERPLRHHWVRGVCQYGIMPANGLIYVPPHACACYLHTKLRGFNALAPGEKQRRTTAPEPVLEKGPAYGAALAAEARPADWPTYRHDPLRSGVAGTEAPAKLNTLWQTRLGGKLSAATAAEGKLFLADIDAHTVYALDATSGKVLWRFIAGGRVDSPPSYYRGLLIFGCADGWVYCLRAADGALAWRFRAAPEERRVVSYGRVESAWPVHGSVLVYQGSVYFAAGRSSYLDSGIYLHRLDAATGKVLAKQRIYSPDPKTGTQPENFRGMMFMVGVLTDVLSCDGSSIYMGQSRYDVNCREQSELRVHLFSPTGFLDDTWFHRTYWLYAREFLAGWRGWWQVGNTVPSGRILAVGKETIYGFGRDRYPGGNNGQWRGGEKYQLFACDRSAAERAQSAEAAAARRRGKTQGKAQGTVYRWTKRVPLLVRAMVLAGDTLFVAGPPDVVRTTKDPLEVLNGAEALAALEGKKGGLLWAVSGKTGDKLAEYKLASPPVFDGLLAADGKLYLVTLDGSVLCFG